MQNRMVIEMPEFIKRYIAQGYFKCSDEFNVGSNKLTLFSTLKKFLHDSLQNMLPSLGVHITNKL